jgi:hypothetical protein
VTTVRLLGILGLGACAILGGCRQTDFPQEKAQVLVSDHPIHLDAEQVMLSGTQLDCGIKAELWDPPSVAGDRTVARLQSAGRALNFDDDIVIGEPGNPNPYVQIRGDFPASLGNGTDIRDSEEGVKIVTGKLGISIPHACFPDPLPLLGVRKGKFSEEAQPVMRFELLKDGWHYVKLVH